MQTFSNIASFIRPWSDVKVLTYLSIEPDRSTDVVFITMSHVRVRKKLQPLIEFLSIWCIYIAANTSL